MSAYDSTETNDERPPEHLSSFWNEVETVLSDASGIANVLAGKIERTEGKPCIPNSPSSAIREAKLTQADESVYVPPAGQLDYATGDDKDPMAKQWHPEARNMSGLRTVAGKQEFAPIVRGEATPVEPGREAEPQPFVRGGFPPSKP
jgi:hypothetical protein